MVILAVLVKAKKKQLEKAAF